MNSAEKALTFYKKLKAVYDIESRRYTKNRLERSIHHSLDVLDRCNRWINDSRKGRIALWKEQLQELLVGLKMQSSALDKPFRLFIIGTGKAGKSSVLNALIGQKVAEVNFVAQTWKIDVFHDSENKNTTIKYADGTEELYSEEEAKNIVENEEKDAKKAEKQLKIELGKIRRNKDLIGKARKEAEQSLKRQYGYQTQIVEADWPVEGSNILKHFSLVDTPGTDQSLTHRNVKNNEIEYFRKANGILWVIPADKLSEENTHDNILSLEKKYGRKSEKTIAIINQMDKIRQKDPEHGIDKVMQEAKKLYGKHFRNILPFEANSAYQAVCNIDEDGMKASGLSSLLRAIRDEFFLTAKESQLLDMQDSIQKVQDDISIITKQIMQELEEQEEIYNQKKEAWNQEISKSQDLSLNQMQNIFSRTLQRIKANAERYEDKLDVLKGDERQAFIEEYVLDRSLLVDDFECFRDALENDLQFMLRTNRKKMVFVEYPNLFSSLQNESQDCDDIGIASELGMDEELFSTFGGQALLMGAIGTGVAVLLGPLGIAAGLLAATPLGHSVVRWFQKITGNGIVDKITKTYKRKFDEEQVKLEESIQASYQATQKKLLDLEDKTFSQVYAPIADFLWIRDWLKTFNQSVSKITIENISLPELIKGA